MIGTEAVAARFSHAELYQNGEDRQTLARYVPARRARVVGNGTDLSRFGPDPLARAEVRAELGVADDELLVGGVGRRVAEKGIAEFGAAARALAGKARFVWVGPDDPDKPDALADAEAGVEFLGLRSDMERIYAALDVFVLPVLPRGLQPLRDGGRRQRAAARAQRHPRLPRGGPARGAGAARARRRRRGAHRRRRAAARRPRPARHASAPRPARRALAEFDQRAVAAVSLATYDAVLARRARR